jgi:hypothetical protein
VLPPVNIAPPLPGEPPVLAVPPDPVVPPLPAAPPFAEVPLLPPLLDEAGPVEQPAPAPIRRAKRGDRMTGSDELVNLEDIPTTVRMSIFVLRRFAKALPAAAGHCYSVRSILRDAAEVFTSP